jgi:hypothetical protein
MRSDADTPHDPEQDYDPDLAERGRALVAAAVADVRAPMSLRESLEAQRTRTAPARRRRRLALGSAMAGVAALAVVFALLVAPGGTPGGPSVVEAAALSGRAATAPAPARDSGDPHVLMASEGGIAFPAWDEIDWPAKGVRHDKLGGRDTTTVFYRTAKGATVAYTIVGGKPLDPPDGATTTELGGTEVRQLRRGGRWIVTWEREGHTCILTAPAAVSVDSLVGLTAWR